MPPACTIAILFASFNARDSTVQPVSCMSGGVMGAVASVRDTQLLPGCISYWSFWGLQSLVLLRGLRSWRSWSLLHSLLAEPDTL